MTAPHGGALVHEVLEAGKARQFVEGGAHLPRIALSTERAYEVVNLTTGVFSPLRGFMGRHEVDAVAQTGRLPDGLPWTIPIVLDVDEETARGVRDDVLLTYRGRPLARMRVNEQFAPNRSSTARGVFGTETGSHPGVAQFYALQPVFLAGPVELLESPDGPYDRYTLTPRETRVLFTAKGWRTVVGFQTRNVPHLGHEYVQKTALTFVDGIFINPVIGRKKPGDFRDEVILSAYEALIRHYYLRDRTVFAVLPTEMRYAGPREAVFHAIIRKNFGCTHFVVGRDHAGVGNFYGPYAAQ